MAIAYQVFTDVSNVSLAATPVQGVQAVRLAKVRPERRAAGDGELYDTLAATGPCKVSGTITTVDPASASAIDGHVGALSFVWKAAAGADKTVTVSNVSVIRVDLNVADKGSSAAVHFIAASDDGTTDPVLIA